MRIVSLLPSATEMICQLGLQESLVGVTHECDFPVSVCHLPKVTRNLIPANATSLEIDQLVRERLKTSRALYTLDTEELARLKPDLIVTQALCDVCAVAEAEVQAAARSLSHVPAVLNLEPLTLQEVFASLHEIGEAAGVSDKAHQVVQELERRVQLVIARSKAAVHRPRVVMLEWLDPPFSCGHWSPELIQFAGGDEQIGRTQIPSRTIGWQDVLNAQPEVILVACCGFDVRRTLIDLERLKGNPVWKQLPAVKSGEVYVFDGGVHFNRPGPRLVDTVELIAHVLHPDRNRAPVGIEPPFRFS